ncbi:DUF937 domain-containing protein [Planctomyces sp. SH-PL62]|uniref:DUF937 domain-containing protein n=1 Tax=Planctomyces sp. SH-PL62 TaxID=1636152 RepID=UPI00078B6B68|nr:DUF937 domain-containing protein [Planctomyces sp. SH-PL62]AMV40321.1 OmpA family protein [Planctomyces sp. SH-PL62]
MTADLLGRLNQAFDAHAVQKLSVALDEQPDRVKQAIALGGPAILAGLLHSATGSRDAAHLMDELKNAPERTAGLGDAAIGVSAEDLARGGASFLHAIFGDRLGRVVDLIADDSGARSTSAAAILGTLAPAAAGVIRDALGAGGGLNLDGFRRLMRVEADAITHAIPGGLAEAIGLKSLAHPTQPESAVHGTTAGRIASRAPQPHHHDDEHEHGSLLSRWGIPVALGVLVLLAAYSLLPPNFERNVPADRAKAPEGNRPATDLARGEPEESIPTPAVTNEGRPVVATAARGVSLALPGDVTIEVPPGSYLEAMVKVLRDGKSTTSQTFVAGELAFDGEGRLTSEADDAIERLAKVALAYPNAKLTINGRETLEGDVDNARKVAASRAEAVREALVKAGVPADRLTAGTVAANLPAEHPAAVAEADVPISISIEVE